MPGPLLETAAVLQSAAGRVETLDLAGTQRVGSVDPGDTGFGKKLSVIVGVEIVDIDFEAFYIDKVLGTELGPFEQLAEIGQVRAVELVQKEISIGNILMVLDLQGVDRGPALEALAVALALLMTCDGSKSERSEMTFGADAEETLVLLPKTDKTRIGQLQGGITALDLLENRIVFAIIVELDLIASWSLKLEPKAEPILWVSWLIRTLINSPTLPSTVNFDSWSMANAGNFEGRPIEVCTWPSVHSLLPEIMIVREPLRLRLGPSSPIKRCSGFGAEKGTVHSKRPPLRRRCFSAVLRKSRRINLRQICRCSLRYSRFR